MNTSVKSDLHRLIDELDEAEASRLLQLVADPLERSLFLAPVDDEPVTEADLAAIKDAEAAYQRGEWVADEDLTL